MKLKNLAVLIIAAIMTVMLYALGATVYSADTDEENSSLADSHDYSHSGWTPLYSGNNFPTEEGHYILMGDEDVVKLNTKTGNNRVTDAVDICLNGHTLEVGGAGYISVGNGTLTICNHSSKEVEITTNYTGD